MRTALPNDDTATVAALLPGARRMRPSADALRLYACVASLASRESVRSGAEAELGEPAA
jgi:hypothetical protein